MRFLTLLRVVVAGAVRQDRLRTSLAVLAIALGVALGFAVQMINATAVNELELSVQALAGEADLQVRGPRSGFDETLYPELARHPDVAAASPVVEVDARIAGREESLHVVGVDLFRAAAIQPSLLPATHDRLDMLRPDVVFLSVAAAQALHRNPGDTIELQAGADIVALRVAG
ncbi:MAG TPA: ABC transporter permease, partial [Casimicrobiaceae bacterium]|nr:ABC transporter permease [Casimicrobiaceae bacterium]